MIFIGMKVNKEKLMELPYGERFKQTWFDYVTFTKEIGGNASTYSQNWVLARLIEKCKSEDDAIAYIKINKITAQQIATRKLLMR